MISAGHARSHERLKSCRCSPCGLVQVPLHVHGQGSGMLVTMSNPDHVQYLEDTKKRSFLVLCMKHPRFGLLWVRTRILTASQDGMCILCVMQPLPRRFLFLSFYQVCKGQRNRFHPFYLPCMFRTVASCPC